MNDGINNVLCERGVRYGKFVDQAGLSQSLKLMVRAHMTEQGTRFDDDQQEAMDMILHKISRIANGDPNYADSWIDIAGYAKLVADRLNGTIR